jgi:transposase
MGRAPAIPSEQKTRIVLAVVAGEVSVAEATRKEKVSEQSIGGGPSSWRRARLR